MISGRPASIAWISCCRRSAPEPSCCGPQASLYPPPAAISNPLSSSDTHDFVLRTPKSYHTSSDEVFQLAHSWISNCTCADSWNHVETKWYPKRLIDIRELRAAKGMRIGEDFTFQSQNSNLERTRVRLVETDAESLRRSEFNRFVTLSHCWGRPKSAQQSQTRLTSLTEEKFKTEGIELRAFAKTFRDAILFACRLEKVGYIWIDSLCIKQRSSSPGVDPRAAEEDWLEQSLVMGDIYRESYLNISAAAAVDGDKGLFFPRQPDHLWEDEINLNLLGLPSHQSGVGKALKRYTKGVPAQFQNVHADHLRRCVIIDVAFWQDLVDNAPLNQRAWVLQERLMAPRVLHFCGNQIAWECAEIDLTEGHPEGVPPYKVKFGEIVREGRFKSLDPEVDGRALRKIRLKGLKDPDEGLQNLYVYELWKRVVETYSKTKLTVSRDKLIALSGIAKWFRNQHLRDVDYVAGLWGRYLESQLLWRVEPVFENGRFQILSTRDASRAPSFSWAALDVPQGIVYGEATDYQDENGNTDELFFKVVHYHLPYRDESSKPDQFGLIKNDNNAGFIMLKVTYICRIKLRRLPGTVPYAWFIDDGTPCQLSDSTMGGFTNVYLDAPDSDVDIFSDTTELYCMPAAYGERTVKKTSRYLLCLLLQKLDNHGNFKRIGLAKLSNYANKTEQDALLAEKHKIDCIIRIR